MDQNPYQSFQNQYSVDNTKQISNLTNHARNDTIFQQSPLIVYRDQANQNLRKTVITKRPMSNSQIYQATNDAKLVTAGAMTFFDSGPQAISSQDYNQKNTNQTSLILSQQKVQLIRPSVYSTTINVGAQKNKNSQMPFSLKRHSREATLLSNFSTEPSQLPYENYQNQVRASTAGTGKKKSIQILNDQMPGRSKSNIKVHTLYTLPSTGLIQFNKTFLQKDRKLSQGIVQSQDFVRALHSNSRNLTSIKYFAQINAKAELQAKKSKSSQKFFSEKMLTMTSENSNIKDQNSEDSLTARETEYYLEEKQLQKQQLKASKQFLTAQMIAKFKETRKASIKKNNLQPENKEIMQNVELDEKILKFQSLLSHYYNIQQPLDDLFKIVVALRLTNSTDLVEELCNVLRADSQNSKQKKSSRYNSISMQLATNQALKQLSQKKYNGTFEVQLDRQIDAIMTFLKSRSAKSSDSTSYFENKILSELVAKQDAVKKQRDLERQQKRF